MSLFDLLLTLNGDGYIKDIQWENRRLEELYDSHLNIHMDQPVTELFSISFNQPQGSFTWKGNSFQYFSKIYQREILLFLKISDDKEYLLARALDFIPEGIQIYDKNACAVYFNSSSRRISDIPKDVAIESRHLLDLYDINADISTIMTSLRTESPVINRVDHYKTTDGTEIATSNTAYPIIQGKKLQGAVVFEQTEEIVRNRIRQLEGTQTALQNYGENAANSRFSGYTFQNIIGHGKKLQEAVQLAKKIAGQDCHVLLVGETGTGKEVFAQSIHRESTRSSKRFIALNCAAIPEPLIESLLFGTEKGSFTGSENKAGYFQQADGGTLFLDELNSMSLAMQSKILRVIQERVYRRVGGQKDLHTDIRIISSFNEDPFQAINENRFRRDLFYRLSTVMIDLPPLRQHIDDMEELIRYHLQSNPMQFVDRVIHVEPEVISILKSYQWPGNVRELFHVLDFAQNVAEGDTISSEHLPRYLLNSQSVPGVSESGHVKSHIDFENTPLQVILDEYECDVIAKALKHYGGNITQTASALDIRRQSLQYRIKKYGLII